jgi:hypothetical protein
MLPGNARSGFPCVRVSLEDSAEAIFKYIPRALYVTAAAHQPDRDMLISLASRTAQASGIAEWAMSNT